MSSTPQGAWRARTRSRRALAGIGCALAMCVVATSAQADSWHHGEGHHGAPLIPGNLLLSTTDYAPGDITAGVTQLPPGCATAPTGSCGTAVANGDDFPSVFNNSSVDAFFGIASPVYLDELTPWGQHIGTIVVPTDQFVTSYSSKSELALNLSPEGNYVSFMGYDAQPGGIDVSNANTPGVIDPGNGDVGPYYRVVAQLNRWGQFTFTRTNAYSGDNGRAAITNDEHGQDLLYTAGNAGQSKSPPPGVVSSTGAQFITPSSLPEADQTPGAPTPLGSFNITQLGYSLDKATKDNNYRAIAIHDNVIYYTKGSGGNGIDTVYFVDTTGKACPSTSATPGVGLPVAGAQLPTSPPSFTVQNFGTTAKPNNGLVPTNMCVLKGFPTNLVPGKNTYPSTQNYPFGIWFANDHTLYVADEGSGDTTFDSTTNTYINSTAAAEPEAGLEKWVLSGGSWHLAYTLQNGLALGQPYTVPGYPTGLNTGPGGTGGPWSPATDGLRALAGRVNRDGIATIWAVTSTVSGSGDTGADPDKLVAIADPVNASTPAPWERFLTVRTARFGQLFRGVSFTPGTGTDSDR